MGVIAKINTEIVLRIIVVEDHNSFREVIVQVLKQKEYFVTGLSCAEDFDDTIGGEMVDLFILDLNLPGEDGISLARRIRRVHPNVGIIMLTARNQIKDKVFGYEIGADLYLTKPIEFPELLAAIDAIRRRIEPATEQEFPLVLNSVKLALKSFHGEVNLNPIEARILNALARAKDNQLTSWQLFEVIAGTGTDENISETNLRVQIYRLRSKLVELGFDKNSIKSLYQHGYQLCVQLKVL